MIVVDTNVISELWRISPNASVVAWIYAQAIETLYLSAITVAELRYGIAAMPEGKRRIIFQTRLENEVLAAFSGRILPFDPGASQAYADLMAQARSKGKAIGNADGYIAATAAVYRFMVATRDTAPFEAAEIRTLNPWEIK